MPLIDYREALSNPHAIDHANIEIQGMSVARTVKLGLFTTNENAVKAADRILGRESYPYARVRFAANRKAFRLQPGDPFVLRFDKYGIQQMVCRVLLIEEESVESDKMIVTAIEEQVKAVKPVSSYTEPTYYRKSAPTGTIGTLTDIYIFESPYAITPNQYALFFLVPKKTGSESGFIIYQSQDGEEYYRLATKYTFAPNGKLQEEYPSDTATIDEDTGLLVQFDSAQDLGAIQTITEAELYGPRNASILSGYYSIGNLSVHQEEIVSYREVEPVTSDTYRLLGVLRGALDTSPRTHQVDTNYYMMGTAIQPTAHYSFTLGHTVYFKIVPFSGTTIGDLGDAQVFTHTFTGRAFSPYAPINIEANGQAYNATYEEENIVLTWDPRTRTAGAGTGNPSLIVDSSPTWEGRFRVRVYVSNTLVRTAEDINDTTWNYTTVMNLDDNTTYPNRIRFDVTNYITGSQGEEFESEEAATIEVRAETLSTTTTTTSTTTTTT